MTRPAHRPVIIDDRPYLPSKQAARSVGLCADYITRMCREGSVEGRLIDRRWYVSEDSLRAFLNKVRERKARWHRALSDELKIDFQRAADLRPPSAACPYCGRPLPSKRTTARHV